MAIGAIDNGCIGSSIEVCLADHVAVQLPFVIDAHTDYAAELESLAAPNELADDVALHVETLRSSAALLGEVVAAAEAGDTSRIEGLTDVLAAGLAELASQLDPGYGRAAFVSPFVGFPSTPFAHVDFTPLLGATADEQAYLDAVRSAMQPVLARERCYQGTLRTPSQAEDSELPGRVLDCGAGSTHETVAAEAHLLEPPSRFADEHAWWLAALEASAEHDRLAGDAARAGDMSGFLARMIGVNLVTRPFSGLDPFFGSAVQLPGSRLERSLDPSTALGRDPYAQSLFSALVAYWVADPRFYATLPLEFTAVPRDVALAAAAKAAPDLLATADELIGTLAALEPGPRFAADHERMLEYFGRDRDRLAAYLEAAASGDPDAAQAAQAGGFEEYCATVAGLSEDVRPVSDIFFAGQGCP